MVVVTATVSKVCSYIHDTAREPDGKRIVGASSARGDGGVRGGGTNPEAANGMSGDYLATNWSAEETDRKFTAGMGAGRYGAVEGGGINPETANEQDGELIRLVGTRFKMD